MTIQEYMKKNNVDFTQTIRISVGKRHRTTTLQITLGDIIRLYTSDYTALAKDDEFIEFKNLESFDLFLADLIKAREFLNKEV